MKLTLTYTQAVERLHEIGASMEQLSGKEMSRSERREFDSLTDEFDEVNRHRENLEARHQLARIGDAGGYRRVPGSERDDDTRPRRRGQRTAAMRTLDGLVDGNQLPVRAAETVEALTRSGSPGEQ